MGCTCGWHVAAEHVWVEATPMWSPPHHHTVLFKVAHFEVSSFHAVPAERSGVKGEIGAENPRELYPTPAVGLIIGGSWGTMPGTQSAISRRHPSWTGWSHTPWAKGFGEFRYQ